MANKIQYESINFTNKCKTFRIKIIIAYNEVKFDNQPGKRY